MVNICEMKYSKNDYVISGDESRRIANKIERFCSSIHHKKSINVTLVTVSGLEKSGHWNNIHSVVTADDLFKD